MENSEATKSALFEQICDAENQLFICGDLPAYGQIVRSGPIMGAQYNFDNTIGYVVQIRKELGQFGSDQYLVRHCDGSLRVHENQSFHSVPEDLADQAISFFAQTPDKEGGDTEYTIGDKFPETGFIIEPPDGDVIANQQ
ncbi:hypothetical protein [Photobacterium damselae]|uniref:hypothetical protein n=1 Tax=Photobacterium damselae TaxID=38293 RepID=UPI001F189B1C|nr:hypothetical protein [Photobacterium damselae]UKA04888.1 hypothetical protein IHC89_21835 [Photobacterium damselae subsp. damselae]